MKVFSLETISPEISSTFIQLVVVKQLFGNLDNGPV